MDFLEGYGYAGLFVCSFFAATILPLGSEILFTTLLVSGYNPVLLLAVATSGNVLGSLVNYTVGIRGGNWIMTKLFRLSDAEIALAISRYRKYGNGVLLFAWLPVLGDPLTFVAGVLKTDLWLFILLVTFGKFMRYLLVGVTFMGIWW